MGEQCNWPCWKIMNCEASQECLAKKRPGTPCWEIATELNDYRHLLDICRDCVVYMLKTKNSILSKKEMKDIMTQKASCVLA